MIPVAFAHHSESENREVKRWEIMMQGRKQSEKGLREIKRVWVSVYSEIKGPEVSVWICSRAERTVRISKRKSCRGVNYRFRPCTGNKDPGKASNSCAMCINPRVNPRVLFKFHWPTSTQISTFFPSFPIYFFLFHPHLCLHMWEYVSLLYLCFAKTERSPGCL